MLRHAEARRSRFRKWNPTATASASRPTSAIESAKAPTASQNDSSECTAIIVQCTAPPCRTDGAAGGLRSLGPGQEILERRVVQLQLTERPCLDLPHPLAGHADLAADLLERGRIAVAEAEPGLDHPPGALVQRVQRLLELLAALLAGDLIVGPLRVDVLHHVREQRLAVADRRL